MNNVEFPYEGEYASMTPVEALRYLSKKYIRKDECKKMLELTALLLCEAELTKKGRAVLECLKVDQNPYSYIDYSDLRRGKQNWEYFT